MAPLLLLALAADAPVWDWESLCCKGVEVLFRSVSVLALPGVLCALTELLVLVRPDPLRAWDRCSVSLLTEPELPVLVRVLDLPVAVAVVLDAAVLGLLLLCSSLARLSLALLVLCASLRAWDRGSVSLPGVLWALTELPELVRPDLPAEP